MISQHQSDAHAREPDLRPVPTGAPELAALTRPHRLERPALLRPPPATVQAGRVSRTRGRGRVGG
jgi:hypothetical protein